MILTDGRLNAAIVGQSVAAIAEVAGFTIPDNTRVLIGEVEAIDKSEPFAYEKLSPILAMYRAKDFLNAVDKAEELVLFGGHGHTSSL